MTARERLLAISSLTSPRMAKEHFLNIITTGTGGTTVVNNISMEENPFTSDVQASDFGVEPNLIEFNSVETAPDFYDNIIEETFSVDTEVYKFEIQD